jgi:hypothetical protein
MDNDNKIDDSDDICVGHEGCAQFWIDLWQFETDERLFEIIITMD